MLEVKELTKFYRNKKAVNNASFTIRKGEVTLLLGPNGAGKSTIIKSISGLLDFTGTVHIDDLPNTSIEAKKIFSYVSEIPYPFEYLTVTEHLEFMARSYGIKNNEPEMEHYLELFDLADKKHKLGRELSKGMAQKLSIICGIIVNPKYIMFDEPLIGLDPKAIRNCKKEFVNLRDNEVGVLISTHIIDTLDDIWDNVIILQNGVVKLQNSKEEFEQAYKGSTLEEIFFQITEGVSE